MCVRINVCTWLSLGTGDLCARGNFIDSAIPSSMDVVQIDTCWNEYVWFSSPVPTFGSSAFKKSPGELCGGHF